MKVAITGATGFIGRHLVAHLSDSGADCVVFTRDQLRARTTFPNGVDALLWDPPQTLPPVGELEGLDAVIHLAGEPVAQRWTAKARSAILDSRTHPTHALSEILATLDSPPAVFVSASAIGYYGPRNDTRLDESARPGTDFLSHVCHAWEAAAAPARERGVRVVHPRIGIVLGPDGGALSMMLTPFRLGLGGPIGNGRQWMSWIHVDDVVGMILHAVRTPDIEGPVNLTAPEPVRNREFSHALGKALGRPAWLPTPVAGLRLMYGQFADILATGQRVVPAKALSTGYEFRFPDLVPALAAALS